MTTIINADNGVVSGSAGLKETPDSSGILALQTNGVTAVTVNSDKSIGLGDAPNAGWDHTVRSVVQLPGNNSLAVVTSNNNLHLLTNTYVDAGGSKYAATGFATQINSLTSNGAVAITSYTSGTVGNALATAASVQLNQADFEMNTATGGIGYGVGSGGTVTQVTSRTTAVTLNKPTGSIQMVSAAGVSTGASFTVNNTLITVDDTIILNQRTGTNTYDLLVTAVAAGSFRITFRTTGGTATDAPIINFAIIRGATA